MKYDGLSAGSDLKETALLIVDFVSDYEFEDGGKQPKWKDDKHRMDVMSKYFRAVFHANIF